MEKTDGKCGPGRPRVHATAAERQRAYRQRRKAEGWVEVKRMVRVPGEVLESEWIDLSAIPAWRR
jgi:hypothetical protein